MTIETAINLLIDLEKKDNKIDPKLISDGYHTFGELYQHRIVLYIALCRILAHSNYNENSTMPINPVWRSKKHSDGSMFEDMFILGIFHEKRNQITYHLHLDKWNDTGFAITLENAPEFDGHSSDDVLERIKNL